MSSDQYTSSPQPAGVVDSSAYSGITLKKIHVVDLSEMYGPEQRGLVADEKIHRGEFILQRDPATSIYYEFGDERGIYTLEKFFRLIDEQQDSDAKKYLIRYSLQYDNNHVYVPKNYLTRDIIDLWDFMNHSCESNCFQVDSDRVVALQDIEPGSLLTVDYGLYNTDDMQLIPITICRCGTPTCAGSDIFKRYKQHDWQNKFYEYCSPYVKAKIDEIRKKQEKT